MRYQRVKQIDRYLLTTVSLCSKGAKPCGIKLNRYLFIDDGKFMQ